MCWYRNLKSVLPSLHDFRYTLYWYVSEWNWKQSYKFFNAKHINTDYGSCCVTIPQFDFASESNRKSTLTGDDYLSIPKGSSNGVMNGIKMILDVEQFEYTFVDRGAVGFRLSMSDPRDHASLFYDSAILAPGTEVMGAIIPTVVNTTEKVLNRFSPLDRGCYTDDVSCFYI